MILGSRETCEQFNVIKVHNGRYQTIPIQSQNSFFLKSKLFDKDEKHEWYKESSEQAIYSSSLRHKTVYSRIHETGSSSCI